MVFNFTEDFHRNVVEPYINDHAIGITPNPCIECNRHLKFDRLHERGIVLGFDAVATGHHARVTNEDGVWKLVRGHDMAKDQSYVVHMMDQHQLSRTLFPVGEMTKAVILALAIGLPLAALLFEKKIIDPHVAIPATFWIGSLAGGLLFGIGMVFAGGCALGSLWHMGEGHLKLWVSMFFFAWTGSTASALFKKFNLTAIDESNVELFERTTVGFQAYLPEMLSGWGATLAISAGLLGLWYALVRYNESTEKFTLM